MDQVSLSGIVKVCGVNLSIVLLSGLTGVSLNRAFVNGPQQTTYPYVSTAGGTDFRPMPGLDARVYPGFQGVTLEEMRELSSNGEVALLDGRSRQDYENGHIPGAYHLAWIDFDRAFAGLASRFSKDTHFVIYCRGGDCSLSRQLADLLYDKGYAQVRIYGGGYNDWFLNSNPVEKGEGRDFLKDAR